MHLIVALQRLDGFLRVGVPHSNASVEASRYQVVKPLHDHHSHDDIRVSFQRHHFLALADIPPWQQQKRIDTRFVGVAVCVRRVSVGLGIPQR